MRRVYVVLLVVVIGCASPVIEQLKVDLKYGRIDAAIEHGEEAVAKEPGNPIAHFLLGQAYIHASRWLDATAEVDNALKLDSVLVWGEIEKEPGVFWTAYYNAGIQFTKQEDYAQANRFFVRATKIDPSKPEAYNNLGFSFLMLGDEEMMLESYAKAIEQDSTNAEAYFNIGFYHTNRGEYEQALEYMNKAEKFVTPQVKRYTDEFFNLAPGTFAPAEREVYLDRLSAEDSSGKREILTSELQVDNPDRALALLDEVQERNERLGEILTTIGLIHLNTQKVEEAETALRSALTYVRSNPDTYFYLVLALQRQQKYDEALSYLDKMIETHPSDIRGWFQLGVSHFRIGKYDDAIQAFSEVIRLQPDRPDAYVNRGNVYAKKADLMKAQGKIEEEKNLRDLAKADFEKAEDLERIEEP